MASLPDLPEGPRPAGPPLAQEVAEGLELCAFVTRMRLKNRILVDVLTDAAPGDVALRRWLRFAGADLRRLASQAQADAVRAARLRNVVPGLPGRARSPHDYRSRDAGHLDRRARIGRAVARRLRRRSRDRHGLAELVRSAGSIAAGEIRGAAAGLPDEDAAVILERAARIERLSAGRSARDRGPSSGSSRGRHDLEDGPARHGN